jgi:hypothetical protein
MSYSAASMAIDSAMETPNVLIKGQAAFGLSLLNDGLAAYPQRSAV